MTLFIEKIFSSFPAYHKSILQLLWALVIFFVIASCILILSQRQMIYLRSRYPFQNLPLSHDMTILTYSVHNKPQRAFFYHPQKPFPKQVWVFFGGNASLALQWLTLIQPLDLPDTGYLMLDYPGYGFNPGTPSQTNITLAVTNAFQALHNHYDQVKFCRTHVVGHSLGSAVAIHTAAALEPDSILLISPFTSMFAMSKRVVGSPWAWCLYPFLWDRYDNAVTLKQYIEKHPRTKISIMHGTQDDVVPFAMGQSLADANPSIHFTAVATDHDLPVIHPEHIQNHITQTTEKYSSSRC